MRSLLLLLLFLAAAILHSALLFAACCTALGLVLSMRVWTRGMAAQVEVGRRLPRRAFAGDVVTVTLRVRNRGWLPIPFLEARETIPKELSAVRGEQVLSLGRQDRIEMRYQLSCSRRGVYTIGPLDGRLGDVLGISQQTVIRDEPGEVIVYPRVVPIERLGLPTQATLTHLPVRDRLTEDPSRISGVRDYRPDDSPRRIHWTATARLDRLSVKQYQPAVTRDTLICLDVNPHSYPWETMRAIELAIVTAASLVHHIVLREGLAAGLISVASRWSDGERRRIDLPVRTGRDQLKILLEALAPIRPSTAETLPAVLREMSHRLRWGTTVIAVTGKPSGDLIEMMSVLRRHGHPAAVIAVAPDVVEAPAWRGRVPVHRVWSDADLAELA